MLPPQHVGRMATSPQSRGLQRHFSTADSAGDEALPLRCQEDVIVKCHAKKSSLPVETSSHQGKGEQIFDKFPELPVEIQNLHLGIRSDRSTSHHYFLAEGRFQKSARAQTHSTQDRVE